VSGSELSREELLALVEQQARAIETLNARVAELERQLGRNSLVQRAEQVHRPPVPAARATGGLAVHSDRAPARCWSAPMIGRVRPTSSPACHRSDTPFARPCRALGAVMLFA
jgi:hypothetical protein